MKRSYWAVPTLALLLAASPGYAQDKLKIGFISTLSSPTSTVGPDLLDGFRLGIKDHGDQLGGRSVNLIVADDQMKPDVGVQLARKMLDEERVDLVTGIVLSNVTLAVAHTVLPRKTFMLSLNSGPSQLAGKECSPYFFAVSYQNDTVPEAMALYLQKKGVKRVALMAANYAAGKDMLAGFKRDFKGEVVSEIYTPLEQFDFAAELAEVRNAKPDAMFFFYTAGAPSINLVKQYAEAGLKDKVPLYAMAFSIDELTLPGMGDAALGIQESAFWNAQMDIPINKIFVAHFQEAYHWRPSIFAAIAYDGASLIDSAVKAVDGHIERKDDFRKAMEAAKFNSVRGKFRFNTNHMPIQNMYLIEVKRDASGALVNAYKDLIDEDHTDSFAAECKMP